MNHTFRKWMEGLEKLQALFWEKLKNLFRTRNKNTFFTTDVMRIVSLFLIAFSTRPVDYAVDYMISGYIMAGFVLADACYYGTHKKKHLLRLFLLGIITEPFYDFMAGGTLYDMQIQNPLLLAAVMFLPLCLISRLKKNEDSKLYPYRHVFYYVLLGTACLLAARFHIPYPEVVAPAMVLPVILRRYRTLALLFFMLLACMTEAPAAVGMIAILFLYNDKKLSQRKKVEKWIPYLLYAAILFIACIARIKGGNLCHITNMP